MPAGLQVFDENGVLVVDTNDFLGRIVGSVSTNFNDGSIAADLSTGTPFAFPYLLVTGQVVTSGSGLAPEVTTTSSSVSWEFADDDKSDPGGNTSYSDCLIFYGVF